MSFVGFKKQEISVKGKSSFNIKIEEDAQLLDELVVVGYGVQKRSTLTGSVAQIDNKIISQAPTANLSTVVAGRLPGLIANQYAGGEPGYQRNLYFR